MGKNLPFKSGKDGRRPFQTFEKTEAIRSSFKLEYPLPF